MRVLHLVDLRHGVVEPIVACRAAAEVTGASHHVIGLGSSRDALRAGLLGLRIDDVLAPPSGAAELAARRLRRLIAARTPAGSARPWADVVQCWSVPILGLARLACGGRAVRIGALLRPPGPSSISMLRSAVQRTALLGSTLFCFDEPTGRGWGPAASALRGGRYGEPDIRQLPLPCPAMLPIADRTAVRARLGVRSDQLVVSLLSDVPRSIDTQRFAFTLGLLYTTGAKVFGVVPRGTRNMARAARFVRMHGRGWGFCASELPATTILAASDVAVWDAPNDAAVCGSTSLAMAMSMGVPLVAARHGISLGALGDVAPQLVARDTSMNGLADRLLALVGDAPARSEVGVRLRGAAQACGVRFQADLLDLWNEAANVPVPRPGLPMPLALAAGAA